MVEDEFMMVVNVIVKGWLEGGLMKLKGLIKKSPVVFEFTLLKEIAVLFVIIGVLVPMYAMVGPEV